MFEHLEFVLRRTRIAFVYGKVKLATALTQVGIVDRMLLKRCQASKKYFKGNCFKIITYFLRARIEYTAHNTFFWVKRPA